VIVDSLCVLAPHACGSQPFFQQCSTFKELSQPIRLSDGSVLGRLFHYFDITREKELDQTKSEFISIASHELRTPMTSIKGSLDLLLGGFAGEVNDETRELLVIAHSGCERLIRLINDILDLSKIEAGKMQLRLHRMNLVDSVQRSVRTVKSYADSLNVKLEVEVAEPLPEICGDKDRLDQVVTNLLGNAIKFSPPEGTVTVSVKAVEDGVECRVIDTGQDGISHSEGQGVAMLLAVHHGDRASFERIWQWTKANLQVREDNLLAWRWTPEAGISDKNNASDGDLLVAWSLLRAFDKWHVPAHLQESRNIARDIREKLLRKTPQGLILLPGIEGFEKSVL